MGVDTLPVKCGVYGIVCDRSEMIYVGGSRFIRTRVIGHVSRLRAGRHSSWKLQRDWRRYGEVAFSAKLIELCSIDLLREREQFWLDELKVVVLGYNVRPEAIIHDQEVIERLRTSHRGIQKSPETIEIWRAANIGKMRQGSALENIRRANSDPARREKISRTMKKVWAERKQASE